MSRISPWQRDEKSPEERLWQAVCLMFLLDVQMDYDLWVESYNGTRAKAQDRIRNHMHCLDSDHMELVCELAGVDYSSFRVKIMDVIDGAARIDVRSLHLY